MKIHPHDSEVVEPEPDREQMELQGEIGDGEIWEESPVREEENEEIGDARIEEG